MVYQIEDKLNPGQTKQATITITVDAPAMVATNDSGTINGLTGGTAVANVLVNDTYNGNPATLNDVTITQVSTSNPKVTVDPATGKVNVAANTPAGTYTLVYQIEDKLNPGQTKQATVTITVDAPAMVAMNDSGSVNGLSGGTAVANVLVNDTYNGNPATLNDVTITQVSTSNPKVTVDLATGKVNVAPNTPSGTYTLVYQIEDKLNPGQTKQATVTITVDAPAMVATNDSGSVNGATGGTAIGNVLANDTYNGNPVTLNDVKLSQVSSSSPNLTLDPLTGKVNVAPNTPTGTYTLVYEIEDLLNPGQKKTATITINVTSGTLAATPDTGTILGFFGGTIQMNILANDTYNAGAQATVSNVIITQLSTENPKINIDPTTGKVIVQPRTLPGVYVLNYQITDKLDPSNKATATVTITIPNWITDLTVTKTADKTGVEVNENISYTITIRNIGTATVLAGRAIVLKENLPTGLDNISYVATGGTYNATANTFTTAADVDAGQAVTLVVNGTVNVNYAQSDITNSVTVDAAQLAMDPNPNNNAASITTPILKGKVALTKAGTMSADGNSITYTFTIKNIGNVALNNITLVDAKIGLNVNLPSALAVGASTTYSKVYTLSQSDKDLGSVTNTASVSSKSPAGNTITDVSGTDENNDNPTIVTSPQSGSLIFTKVVSGTIPTVVGGTLNYAFKVTNTGNVTLTNIVVTDANATITGSPITSLLPGASANLTAVHVLTQSDIDAGSVTNQASITGKDPKGNNVSKVSDDPNTPAQDDATIVSIAATPAMTFTKVAISSGVNTGDVVTYTITVKNTGNVTLNNIVVTDPNAIVTGGTIATLAPGASVSVTATHILTQSDVNKGTVVNQANASAKDPKGNTISKVSDDPNTPAVNDATIITIGATPSMVLTKTANNTGVKAGDVINYTLIVKNTGNVTLTNVSVTDAGADVGSISPATITTVLPGATAVVTAKHTLTQSEINTGKFSNQASASGTDPKNNTISDPKSDDPNTAAPDDATVVILTPTADLVTVKRLKDPSQISYVPGDEVVYLINIKNNGPSAASNVRIVDYAPLGTSISKWTATATGLTLPYTYGTGNLEQTVGLFPSQAEVTYEVVVKTSNGSTRSPYAGKPLVNTVTVTSATPDLSTVGDIKTTADLPADIRNDLSIVKTSDHLTPTGIDTPFDYTIVVKNNGFFTSNAVEVTDVLPTSLNYVAHVTASGSANFTNANNTLVWNITSLQPGAVAIINIKVKANKPGVISNTATVKSAESDPIMDNNSATDLKEIFALDTRPNVITPNGDGKNDTWVIDGLELYPDNYLTIFNRWGNEVYHSNGGYKNDWSGNGLKEGTYYYLLKVKDTKGAWSVTKGYITLLRNN
ncbi:MAG: DUF11 domain-containing protein [Sphingobacteriaceae bacterium]|nr:MAG: DUF11 domain-containing protein [Sphingobacteriaceae bacterium]